MSAAVQYAKGGGGPKFRKRPLSRVIRDTRCLQLVRGKRGIETKGVAWGQRARGEGNAKSRPQFTVRKMRRKSRERETNWGQKWLINRGLLVPRTKSKYCFKYDKGSLVLFTQLNAVSIINVLKRFVN